MTTNQDERRRAFIRDIFAKWSFEAVSRREAYAACIAKRDKQDISERTAKAAQLIFLLAQKALFLTDRDRLGGARCLGALHNDAPYQELRSEVGEKTVDEMLTELTVEPTAVLLWRDPNHDVMFQIRYGEENDVIKVNDILLGLDEVYLGEYIRNGGKGEALTPKCMILDLG